MKRTLLFLLILIPMISVAQDSKTGFSVTLKGGLTMANMYGSGVRSQTFLIGNSSESIYANEAASNKFRTGMNFGGVFDYRFLKYLSVGIGASYIQKGDKINASQYWNSDTQGYETVDGNIYWVQNYWAIDVPVKVYLPIGNNEIFLKGGFSYSIRNNSKEKGDITIGGADYKLDNNNIGANNNEFGCFVGGGYLWSLKNKPGDILIEAVWAPSLGKSYGRDLIPTPKYYYNQTFSLNVGYRFNWYRQ